MLCYLTKYRVNSGAAIQILAPARAPHLLRALLKSISQLVTALLLVTPFMLVAMSVQAQDIDLSADERAWLKQHPVIRIGIDAAYAPYSFTDKKNQYVGVAPDLLALLEKRLPIRFKPATGLSWPEIVDGARQRSLDVIATAVITDERKQFLNFSQIYIPTPLVIMTRHDDKHIRQRGDIQQRKVALVEGYSSSQQVLKEFPSIKPLIVSTPLEGLRAVATGEAEAYVGVLGINVYLASQHGISNLKVAARYNVETNGQRLGIRSDWPQLVRIIDKALSDISEAEKLTVMRKWVPVKTASDTVQESRIVFSDEEEDFLNAHPVIRVANETDWPPFDFVDKNGVPAGYSIDYFKLVANKLGLRINWVNGYSWDRLLQMGIRRELDAFPAIITNPQRKQHLLFTQPYHQSISGYFVREGKTIVDINNVHQLQNYRLALVNGFDDYHAITTHYPDTPVVTVNTVLDGLKAVLAGDADIFIGDIAVCNDLIEKHLLRGLYQAGRVQLPELSQGENLRFAVRKDWPELLSLLQKGMNVLSEKEIQGLRQRWVDKPAAPLFTKQRLIGLTVIIVLLSLVITTSWIWALRQQRNRLLNEVSKQTRALYESEHRLSLALEGGGMAAWDVYYQTGVMLVSPGWWSMLGLDESTQGNPRDIWLEHIHPDDRDRVMSMAAAYMRDELDHYEVEFRIITPHGDTRWQIVRGAAIVPDTPDQTLRMVGLVQDVTEHKNLERIKDEFIASVSHELRTPLTSIKGALGLVTGGVIGQLADEPAKLLKIAYDNSERLSLLIDDLLDMEKLRAGQMEFHMIPIAINELLKEAVQANQGYADKYGVSISMHSENNQTITGDKNRLLQVMANLISNAAKFSPAGGEIRLRTECIDDRIRISISDQGPGIPVEFQDRIFERFSQADAGDTQGKGGTGLGLAISREIIERHGGQIGFVSQTGQACCFYFELDAHPN